MVLTERRHEVLEALGGDVPAPDGETAGELVGVFEFRRVEDRPRVVMARRGVAGEEHRPTEPPRQDRLPPRWTPPRPREGRALLTSVNHFRRPGHAPQCTRAARG